MSFKQQGEFVAGTKKKTDWPCFLLWRNRQEPMQFINEQQKNRSYMMDLRLMASPRQGGHSAFKNYVIGPPRGASHRGRRYASHLIKGA